jgi:hypothetical protein
MAAAAFTQTLILKGTSNGKVMHVPMSVSDVVGQFAVAPDGNGFLQLPSDQNYAIADVLVITGGTDTNNQDIFANGLQTGIRIANKANLNTANNRQFQNAPVTFRAGSLLRFAQVA